MIDVLEQIAVVTALLYIFFAVKEKSLCFVFGFISSAIFVGICFFTRYYYDMLINIYYCVMSVYGFILWGKNTSESKPEINTIGNKTRLFYFVLGMLLTVLLGWIGQEFLDSSLPFADAFTTSFSIIATWMVVKKNIENWIIWLVVDGVAVYMYFIKDLKVTALLFVVYVVLSIVGYLKWRKELSNVSH